MAAFNKFDAFTEHLAERVHDLGTDTLKVMLTDTAPLATNALKTELSEIAAGNGYGAGGTAVAVTSSAQNGGVYTLVLADVVVSATGPVGPFRYAVLYNDTPATPADPLIGWWDYGSSITLGSGESFTVDFDPATGALQVS